MAGQRNLEAAAERRAVDRGNDRLRRAFHQAQHFGETGRLRRLAEFGDVGAGDEGTAGAGQHDALHLRVIDRALHALEDAAAHRGAERIHGRAVNRDDGNIVMTFELDDFTHRDSPWMLVLELVLSSCTTCVEPPRLDQFRTAKFNSTS